MKKLVLVLSLLSAVPAFADETVSPSLTARSEFIGRLCRAMGGAQEQIRIKPEADTATSNCLKVTAKSAGPVDLYMVGMTRDNGETEVIVRRFLDKTTGEVAIRKLISFTIPDMAEAERVLGL